MPLITLDFPFLLNVSVQIGDVVYYAVTSPVGPNVDWPSGRTPHFQAGYNNVIKIGIIVDIPINTQDFSQIEADMPQSIINEFGLPPEGAFIMFSKDNKVNLSSMLGYYASVKMVNNSTSEAELFSVGTDVVESSK